MALTLPIPMTLEQKDLITSLLIKHLSEETFVSIISYYQLTAELCKDEERNYWINMWNSWSICLTHKDELIIKNHSERYLYDIK